LESSDPPEVDSVQVEESEFDSPEVEEKDLNNLTIPAVLFNLNYKIRKQLIPIAKSNNTK